MMAGPREVVRDPVPWSDVPDAAAWLLGYVRTDVPGYREFTESGNLAVIASSTGLRFDDLVDAVNTASVDIDAWTWGADGKTYGAGNTVGFPDRLGWVCGFAAEAGATVDDLAAALFIPPAGIPLMGATWTRVESEADRRQVFDRSRRNQGYFWGDALVWSCKLTMHRWSLQALMTGWCLRGKVTLGGVSKIDTPISTSDPAGAITGYALGLGGVRWVDSVQSIAEVEMFIGGE